METNKQEIIKSRVGGFGGSDAKMFYKVGLKGIESLSETDKRRIAVALGQAEFVENFTSEAMDAGNKFEKWLGEKLNIYENLESNFKIELKEQAKEQQKNFKIFAHADFYNKNKNSVIEAKLTTSNLEETINDYMPQLQWYYMLGVDEVYLAKGYQNKPFEIFHEAFIERDDKFIDVLKNGIKIIDEFCNTFVYSEKDEWTENDLLPYEQQAVQLMYNYLSQIKKLEEEVEKQKELLFDVMNKNGVKSIKSDKFILTVVPESVRSTFDKVKLLKEHPEINEADYLKQSVVKPYLKITLK